jgi:hypothetical protein
MSIRVFDPRHGAARAHANPAAPAVWMDTGLALRPVRVLRLPARGQVFAPDAFRRLEDRQFLEMSRAYAAQGGWVSGDEMARRMRPHWSQPISVLARWIVKREIVNIVWHSQILIPVFQFSPDDLQIRRVVRAALAELVGAFDDWEIAAWFAQPNAWLREQRPLDPAGRDDDDVIQAARADRFIARS